MLRLPTRADARRPPEQKNRPFPIKGLDTSSPITMVKDGYALVLDDFVCRSSGVETRSGYTVITSDHGPITALLGYPGSIISATATKVFVGQSEVLSGMTSGDWQSAPVTNDGGRHLVMANGHDSVHRYDGLTFHVADITGINTQKLGCVALHQRRVFFGSTESLDVYYLETDAVEGPVKRLPLEALCTNPGYVQAIASLSPTGGKGADSQLVIITSAGEMIIYTGTDPDSAEAWKLGGVWTMPLALGKNCFSKFGSRLMLLTTKGVLPVPDALATPDSEKDNKAATAIVHPTFDAMHQDQSVYQILDSESAELSLIALGAKQLVMSNSGGWSRFTGLPATCWLEHEKNLYFGTADGKVCKYGGDTDDGAPIRSFLVDSFSRYKSATRKHLKRIRPLYRAAHPYAPRIEVLVDYCDPPEDFDAANKDSVYWQWSDITWPKQPMPWKREISHRQGPWRGLGGAGHALAIQFSVQTETKITLAEYELIYEQGANQ